MLMRSFPAKRLGEVRTFTNYEIHLAEKADNNDSDEKLFLKSAHIESVGAGLEGGQAGRTLL